jgi:hypothetical protein
MCTDGNAYHIYQVNPNGGWSAWSSLMPLNIPAALPFNGLPAVVSGTDGNLPIQVFTVAADGSLWGISQSPPDAGWAPWRYLASPQNGAIPQYQHPAVVVEAGGALSVFVLGPDGNVWGLGQTAAAGPWGPLVTLGS